jgi:hypothetical protein
MTTRARSIAWTLLGLSSLGAPALAQPQPGLWTGFTGQDERINFTVGSSSVSDFEFSGRWSGQNCSGDFEFDLDFPMPIVNGTFMLDHRFGSSMAHLEGSFVSPILAQGTLTATFTGSCAGSMTTEWSASPERPDGAQWPLSLPLTPDEVSCDAARLDALARRVSVDLPHGTKEASVVLSLTRTGDFAGLAYSGQGASSPERLLAFSTNPEETTLLRNPERPQLFSLSATRNDLSSDLVAPGSPDEIRLTLNPTLAADPPPSNLLVLDNVRPPGGSPTAARPGRGLDDLLAPCHGKLTDADVHVFRLLSRMLRVEVPGAKRYELIVFRDLAPHSYRIDIQVFGEDGSDLGKIAVRVEVTYDGTGQLNRGTLRTLGPCTGENEEDCTTLSVTGLVDIVSPPGAGRFWSNTDDLVLAGSLPDESRIDWVVLLRGTTWRQPPGR